MKPNAHQLAMRDPALAALMGVGALGADFGGDFTDELAGDDYGAEFGDEHGAEFGATPLALAKRPPSSQELVRMWQSMQAREAARNRQVAKLDPNRGSGLKVERYILSLSQVLVIGVAAAVNMQSTPDCTFRPQRMSIIVPTPQFVILNVIRMANVEVIIGAGVVDAFQFNANGVGQAMDLPTLTPANRATIAGNYTGFAGGFPGAFAYTLTASFIGPSALAGGAAI